MSREAQRDLMGASLKTTASAKFLPLIAKTTNR